MPWLARLLGLWLAAGETVALWRCWRARRWPSVAGTVLAVDVQWSGVMARGATAAVRYAYEVHGVRFEDDTVRYAGVTGQSSARRALAAAGDPVVGAPVRVYFDPARPARAVLDRDARVADVVLLVVGLVLLAAAGT